MFHRQHLVWFDQARAFIEDVRSRSGASPVAIDEPTLMPNATGMRPDERAAAPLVGSVGGGVQPAETADVGPAA